MDNVVLVVVAVAGWAGIRLWRSGRAADRPFGAFLLALALAGALATWQRWEAVGLAVVAVGLVLAVLPPNLAVASQLARVRGRHRAARHLETAAWLLQPTAIRRLHRGMAAAVDGAASGRLGVPEALDRLRGLARLAPPAGTALLVEAACRIHAARRAWPEVLAGLGDDLGDPVALDGLSLGARDAVVQALLAQGRQDEAAAVVEGMDRALAAERPFLAGPGDLAELPEAFRDRARLRLAVALGGEVEGVLASPSALRALVPGAERRALARDAAGVRAAGRSPAVRERGDREVETLRGAARLPSLLASLRAPAPATAALALFNALLLVPLVLTGSSLDGTHLLSAGAALPSLVLGPEPWRLATSMALHAGPLHLGLNVLFLLHAGSVAERLSGPRRLLAVYLVSGLAGGLLAMALGPERPLVGASGAISGVFAAGGWRLWRMRERLPARWVRRNATAYVQTFLANVLLGLALPMVSLTDHAGGFAAGLATAALLDLLPAGPAARRAGTVVVAALLAVTVAGSALGLAASWQRPLAERVPLREVVADGSKGGVPARVRVGIPATWVEVPPEARAAGPGDGTGGDPPDLRPGWVGYGGQLAVVEVDCGERWGRVHGDREDRLPPGDAAALAGLLEEALGRQPGTSVQAGPAGFALVRGPARDGVRALGAHRQEEAGVVHLHFFFDEGSPEEALLPAILGTVRLESCR